MKSHQELESSSFNNHISNYKCTRKKITVENPEISHKLLLQTFSSSSSPRSSFRRFNGVGSSFSSLLSSFLKIMAIVPATSKWLTLPTRLSFNHTIGRKVTGTLFGNRRGHVSFAVQDDPRSEPVLLLELAKSTSSLVREMASGLLRIALECEKV